LIDGDGEEYDYVKKKKFKVERIGKLLRANSIVPLFGDIAMSIGSILARSPHWNHQKWDLNRTTDETKAELKNSYLLAVQDKGANIACANFKVHMAQLKRIDLLMKESNSPEGFSADCYNTIFNAIKFMSSLTSNVIEQVCDFLIIRRLGSI
jgi:cytoplasmic FMR1 interacting protein